MITSISLMASANSLLLPRGSVSAATPAWPSVNILQVHRLLLDAHGVNHSAMYHINQKFCNGSARFRSCDRRLNLGRPRRGQRVINAGWPSLGSTVSLSSDLYFSTSPA